MNVNSLIQTGDFILLSLKASKMTYSAWLRILPNVFFSTFTVHFAINKPILIGLRACENLLLVYEVVVVYILPFFVVYGALFSSYWK